MSKLTIQFIAYIFLLLANVNADAVTIVETYCNDKAQLGAWEEGLITKKIVGNIVGEFDPEHAALVSYLDKLPVQSNESLVLGGIKVAPQSTIKLIKNSARFQWDIPGAKSHLNIILQFYKGCISQISLMDSNKMVFYNRTNTYSTQP